jgi:hypothetical protein
MARVRCAALRCLARVLELVDGLPPGDATIFSECVHMLNDHRSDTD